MVNTLFGLHCYLWPVRVINRLAGFYNPLPGEGITLDCSVHAVLLHCCCHGFPISWIWQPPCLPFLVWEESQPAASASLPQQHTPLLLLLQHINSMSHSVRGDLQTISAPNGRYKGRLYQLNYNSNKDWLCFIARKINYHFLTLLCRIPFELET